MAKLVAAGNAKKPSLNHKVASEFLQLFSAAKAIFAARLAKSVDVLLTASPNWRICSALMFLSMGNSLQAASARD